MNHGATAPWPGWAAVLTTWRSSGPVDVLIGLLAAGYVLGVWRWHRAGARWPAARGVAFGAAVVGLVLTLDSGVGVWGHQVFAVHMIMHLMLIMVVPALAVAGAPVLLARGPRADRAAPTGSRASRLLFAPAVVLAVYALVIVATHLTGFMQAMATSMALHHLEQVLYLAAGLLFFATALGADATPRRPSFLARWLLMLLAMGVDTLVGVVLLVAPHSPFPAYGLADVRLGGAIMWAGGDGLMMLAMVLVGRWWVQSGDTGLGPWLDSARRQAVDGRGRDDHDGPDGSGDRGDPGDLDSDDDALAAYNAMLARLHDRGV